MISRTLLLQRKWICSEKELSCFFSEWFVPKLQLRDLIFLEGVLGSGKSTWVQMLLRAFGKEKTFAGSPSFSVCYDYKIDPSIGEFKGDLKKHQLFSLFDKKKSFFLKHFDFYRIQDEIELQEMGILDPFWEEEEVIWCVEWINKVPFFKKTLLDKYPARIWNVHIEFLKKDEGKDPEWDFFKRNYEIKIFGGI